MDQYVKASIDGRRNAIVNSYDLDEKAQAEVNELFREIEKLGASCADAGDFETKFAASPLNQKYMDLFTEIATKSANKAAAGGMAAGMAGSVAGSVAREAIGSAIPTTRAAVNQKAYDAARDIPVVGDAIDLGQKAGYAMHLGKLFGKKKK